MMSNPTLEIILRDSVLGKQIRHQEKQRENEEKQRQKSYEAKKKREEIVQEILKEFAQKFPKAFGENKIPFKIGIKEELLEAFKDSGYSKSQINAALKYHLSSYQYYSSMLNHKKRYDLAGNFVADIEEDHLAYAAKQVAYLKRKAEQRKCRKNKYNNNGKRRK